MTIDPDGNPAVKELAAARQRIAELEVELHKARRKGGIGELAPQWIVAITGVLVALTGAGIFTGKAIADSGNTPRPSASSSSALSAAPSSAVSQAAEPSPTSAGALYLSEQALPPAQGSIGNLTSGSVQIGTKTYPNSIRFTCAPFGFGQGSLTFNVAGYAYFNATVGVPNDATNGTGNSMTVTFLKDDGSTQLATPLTIVVGRPLEVHLALKDAAQLQVRCASKSKQNLGAAMDAALGDAALAAA